MYKLLDDVETEKIEKLKDFMDIIYNFDTYGHYKIDEYLNSCGLAVDPDYETFGIDTELLRSREAICEAFDIKVTSTIFTSTHSNSVADELDFKVDGGMRYNDVRKILSSKGTL
ncbi:uncharacterized protein LOC116344866 [Contarinia nasturtii]|uniref:uncharacterized protein LOC116344866 n=1 Tax=Contarinia nasturtii TaxID=265458 RepID=UPI0012D3FCBC|nr:uncharacterized protein LOC116344866 [Contarinia nasturtii]